MNLNQLVADVTQARTLAGLKNYYVATNPTWGTALTMSAAARTTFLATEALMTVVAPAAGSLPVPGLRPPDLRIGKSIMPDFLLLTIVGANTNGTSAEFGVVMDVINRYSSGGTLLTGKNAHTDNVDSGGAVVRFGNVTALDADTPRQIARVTAKKGIFVAGDRVLFLFGNEGSGAFAGLDSASAAGLYVVRLPPVVLHANWTSDVDGGGDEIQVLTPSTLLLHYWSPAQSAAPTCEVSLGWWER